MASSGDIWGSNATSDSTVGYKTWSNISNFNGNTTSTEMSFSGALAQTNSYYVKTDHVHGLTAVDIITYVACAIERRCDNTDDYAKDTHVQLIVNGTIQATNKASAADWPTTKAFSAGGAYTGNGASWGYSGTLYGLDTLGIAFAANCGGKHSSMWASRITMVITYDRRGLRRRSVLFFGWGWFALQTYANVGIFNAFQTLKDILRGKDRMGLPVFGVRFA